MSDVPPFVERLRAARASGDVGELTALMGAVPFAAFLGIEVAPGETGELQARMRFAEHVVGNPGLPAIHGGAIATLLETAAIARVLWEADPEVLPRPVTLTFDYLRSGRPADVHASARIVRQGRRVCTVRVAAWQEDRERPVALANATLLLC
ncbi:MAG: PaaI family thioesterase [Myxococcota bacterium]